MTSLPSEEESGQSSNNVEILASPRIAVIPFAVVLPPSTLQDFDNPTPKALSTVSIVGDNSIVGSTVLLKNSVMVWVGWGKVDLVASQSTPVDGRPASFGKGT